MQNIRRYRHYLLIKENIHISLFFTGGFLTICLSAIYNNPIYLIMGILIQFPAYLRLKKRYKFRINIFIIQAFFLLLQVPLIFSLKKIYPIDQFILEVIIIYFYLWLLISFIDHIFIKSKLTRHLKFLRKIYISQGILQYIIAPILIIIAVNIYLLLEKVLPEYFQYGWLALFSQTTKSGNVNMMVISIFEDNPLAFIIIPLLFLLILYILPYLAKMEEIIFRKKARKSYQVILYNILFGFTHLLIGINLIAAITIIFLGIIFSVYYLSQIRVGEDKALNKVIALHTTYNAYLFFILAFITLSGV